MEFIDENPGAGTTTADLAALAGVSARTLQAGFQEIVGMSPTAYLRGVRLDRVHQELAAGERGSVTDVAARWGFFHPGRFAQQYRDRFGVLPSETARRALPWPGGGTRPPREAGPGGTVAAGALSRTMITAVAS
jgi:transcriptional regulator GlxA family with amidase domain